MPDADRPPPRPARARLAAALAARAARDPSPPTASTTSRHGIDYQPAGALECVAGRTDERTPRP